MSLPKYLTLAAFSALAYGGNVETDSNGSSFTGGTASFGAGVGGANAGGFNGVGTAVATGGADPYYPGGMVSGTPADVQRAFDGACTGVDVKTGSCTVTIPPPTSGANVDPTKIIVIYQVNGGSTDQEFIGRTYDNCPQGDGWYLVTGADGSLQVVLCPRTCATIHLDMGPVLSVYAGCTICPGCQL